MFVGGHHFKEEMRNLGIREGKIVTILGRNGHKTLIEVEGKKNTQLEKEGHKKFL